MNLKCRNILFIVCIIVLSLSVFMGIRLYTSNINLSSQLTNLEEKYQELRLMEINDSYSESRNMKLSLINEEFRWLGLTDTGEIILENYDGEKIDLTQDGSEVTKLILQGLDENYIISPDNMTNPFLRNDSRFYYTLRYNINDIVHEIFIFDDGTIKYKNEYFNSPILLSAAQAVMPVINAESNKTQPNAIDFMLNCSLATSSYYKITEEEPHEEQSLSQLWDNGVRMRASAYFIKEYMIKADENFKGTEASSVMKSLGYNEGQKAEMYIYYGDNGKLICVKFVYNNAEVIYIMNPEVKMNPKILFLPVIWSAS